MKDQGITNPYTQVGILSCIAKESGFIPQSELSYSTTENNIIKQKFGTRISSYSDKQLTELKKDDEKFFDAIYNQYKKDPTTNKQKFPKEEQYTRETGNNNEGDGYTYRGRGYNGITFKSLYKQYGDLIGEDLVTNPDLLNDPEIAAKVALAFFKKGNKNNDLSDLTFTDKTTATKYFTDLNA
jgi:predicted chitinase